MMASGVQRSKHALSCAQHPAPMIISSTEGRNGITEPPEHYHYEKTLSEHRNTITIKKDTIVLSGNQVNEAFCCTKGLYEMKN